MQLLLTNVRASYLHCFSPKESTLGGKPKFSVSLLLDKTKDAAQIKAIEKAITALYAEKNKGKALAADRVCLKDGDLRGEEDPAYAGKMYINASNEKRPQVVDRDKTPLAAEDGKPYSGCFVNAVVRLWYQDNQFGKRVNSSLEVVQFWADGEPFGAPPVSLDILPDLENDDLT